MFAERDDGSKSRFRALPALLAPFDRRKHDFSFPACYRHRQFKPKALTEGISLISKIPNDCCACFQESRFVPRCFRDPVPAALQPTRTGQIRKTVSVLAGLPPVTLRSVSESRIIGFAYWFKAPPQRAANRKHRQRSSTVVHSRRPQMQSCCRCLFQDAVGLQVGHCPRARVMSPVSDDYRITLLAAS